MEMKRDDNDAYDPRFPPDVPRGPVQVIWPPKEPDHGFFLKVLSAVAASLITLAIGFVGGATWSHNERITKLEIYRVSDKEGQDRIERRVDSLDSRIK